MENAAQPSVNLQKLIENAAQLSVDLQKLMENAPPPTYLTKMNDNPEVQEEENPKSDIDNSPDNSKH
ncbi:MAG: hypothetical protein RIB93_04580 [Coleofasciculus sp. D1-CHI-01]|uniref:hypothetical protein n=1 Tax=Coleofasciculus sp. D1-CHI-01 TaxID=3068482 RepID=UPI003304A1A6